MEKYFISELESNKNKIIENENFFITKEVSNEHNHFKFIFEYNLIDQGKSKMQLNIMIYSKVNPINWKRLLLEEIPTNLNDSEKIEFITRLIRWAFYNNNINNQLFNFSDFIYSKIKIYGDEPLTYPGKLLLEVFLSGLPSILNGLVTIYKFRHIHPNILDKKKNQYMI